MVNSFKYNTSGDKETGANRMVTFDFGNRIFCKTCNVHMTARSLPDDVFVIECPKCNIKTFHRKGDKANDL